VYYKVMKFSAEPTTLPITVGGRYLTEKEAIYFPVVAVRKVGEIIHVATVTSDGVGGFTMKPETPGVDPDKIYAERDELIKAERARQEEERRKQEEQKRQTPEPNRDGQKKQ